LAAVARSVAPLIASRPMGSNLSTRDLTYHLETHSIGQAAAHGIDVPVQLAAK
jgi:hypothetical protein